MLPSFSKADIFYIAVGGMLGSLLRWWLGMGFEGNFPVPTLMVNIAGATALAALHATRHRLHLHGKYLYMVGFCGSFTTVSLYSAETLILFQSGEVTLALLNLLLPVAIALVCVFLILSRFERAPGGTSQ